MSHFEALNLDIGKLVEAEPLRPAARASTIFWVFILIATVVFVRAIFSEHAAFAWAAYYTNLQFWMGLAVGSCIIPAIFQIVRAEWSPPVRRIAEANVAFLPWAYLLFLVSFAGKEHLFPWARSPMPGREWWMQPGFVYARFSLLLLVLFYFIWRFVRMSLRTDIGMIRESAKNKTRWNGWIYDALISNWRGTDKEVAETQPRLSWNAPLLIVLYVTIYSLFSFEMLMGMDTIWYSNMFGGFIFIGNIYMGWATLSIWVTYLTRKHPNYSQVVKAQQFWDMGKLTFGFGILWAYLFFSQFLPQWYGNLPEETQWLIIRTREYPWKAFGWTVLCMCFVIPFITLLSRDVKKTPPALALVCLVILAGMWLEKYTLIMPILSPHAIPFGLVEVVLFLGFFGVYGLSVGAFIGKFPFIPVSSPLTRGSTEW